MLEGSARAQRGSFTPSGRLHIFAGLVRPVLHVLCQRARVIYEAFLHLRVVPCRPRWTCVSSPARSPAVWNEATAQTRVIACRRSAQLQKVSHHPRDAQELVLLPLFESHQSFGRLLGVMREGEDTPDSLLGFHVSGFLEESHERVLVDVLENVRHRALAVRRVKLVAVGRRADPARFWVHVARHLAAFVVFGGAGVANFAVLSRFDGWEKSEELTEPAASLYRQRRSRSRRWHHPAASPEKRLPAHTANCSLTSGLCFGNASNYGWRRWRHKYAEVVQLQPMEVSSTWHDA